jgi:uncharacterized protein YjbI with pentapeptide repeats
MDGARFSQTEFVGCDFDGVDMRHLDTSQMRMTGIDMRGAILP